MQQCIWQLFHYLILQRVHTFLQVRLQNYPFFGVTVVLIKAIRFLSVVSVVLPFEKEEHMEMKDTKRFESAMPSAMSTGQIFGEISSAYNFWFSWFVKSSWIRNTLPRSSYVSCKQVKVRYKMYLVTKYQKSIYTKIGWHVSWNFSEKPQTFLALYIAPPVSFM